jgi:hypothetical protein
MLVLEVDAFWINFDQSYDCMIYLIGFMKSIHQIPCHFLTFSLNINPLTISNSFCMPCS